MENEVQKQDQIEPGDEELIDEELDQVSGGMYKFTDKPLRSTNIVLNMHSLDDLKNQQQQGYNQAQGYIGQVTGDPHK